MAAILISISPDAALDALGSSDNVHVAIPNPLGVEGLPNLYRPVQTLVLALGLAAAASVVIGRRKAGGIERLQIKWRLYASSIWFGGNVLKNTVFSPLGEVSWGLWISYLLVAIGGLGGPIAIGIAILRYSLYEIDILINRTLVYGSLTAMLVALYFGGIVVLQRASSSSQASSPHSQPSPLPCYRCVVQPLEAPYPVVHRQALLPQQVRRRKTLEDFSAKLRNETDLDALSDDLVGVVRETMQPAHVSLWLRPETAQKGEQAE